MYITMVMGTMVVDQYLPPEMHSSPEEATTLLAEMVHATLEPPEPVPPAVQRELRKVWDDFMNHFFVLLEERLQAELS